MGETAMNTQEDFVIYSRVFKLGTLLAILEYNGALEQPLKKEDLLPESSQETLSLFTQAIYRMHLNGERHTIEQLVLSIGDVPRELDIHQYQELVDGYRTECLLQSPYPGYLPRECKARLLSE